MTTWLLSYWQRDIKSWWKSPFKASINQNNGPIPTSLLRDHYALEHASLAIVDRIAKDDTRLPALLMSIRSSDLVGSVTWIPGRLQLVCELKTVAKARLCALVAAPRFAAQSVVL